MQKHFILPNFNFIRFAHTAEHVMLTYIVPVFMAQIIYDIALRSFRKADKMLDKRMASAPKMPHLSYLCKSSQQHYFAMSQESLPKINCRLAEGGKARKNPFPILPEGYDV